MFYDYMPMVYLSSYSVLILDDGIPFAMEPRRLPRLHALMLRFSVLDQWKTNRVMRTPHPDGAEVMPELQESVLKPTTGAAPTILGNPFSLCIRLQFPERTVIGHGTRGP